VVVIHGVGAALLACALWALAFVSPLMVEPYSAFDLAALRYALVLAIALAVLSLKRDFRFTVIPQIDWALALGLGFIGYVGYFFCVAGAVIYAGPVMPPLIIGCLPVVLAVVGNTRDRTLPWTCLMIPLSMIASGLACVNLEAIGRARSAGTSDDFLLGVGLAVGALTLWVWYAVANTEVLRRRRGLGSAVWAAMTGIGMGASMLALVPFGLVNGWSRIPTVGILAVPALWLVLWALVLALLSSLFATWAWSYATRRLPVAALGSLTVSEAVFGLIFGLALHRRWPSTVELIGAALLVGGTTYAMTLFHRGSPASGTDRDCPECQTT
jgi:drug/metabolite transporter (DMT)-like permease